MEKNAAIAIGLAALLVLAVGFWWWAWSAGWLGGAGNGNTMDGNGQTTDLENPATWNTLTDTDGNVIFRYPVTLNTQYIELIDWPPAPLLAEEPFTCTEAGSPEDRAGESRRISVNGHEYCKTSVAEGAAGSVYTQYAYAFAAGPDHTIILTFSLRFPQCVNYDSPQQEACQREQESLNIDVLMDRIISQSFDLENLPR